MSVTNKVSVEIMWRESRQSMVQIDLHRAGDQIGLMPYAYRQKSRIPSGTAACDERKLEK